MGMLFARRKNSKAQGITTTEQLLQKEPKKQTGVKPQPQRNIPVEENESKRKFKV